MKTAQEQVCIFMERIGDPTASKPTLASLIEVDRRADFIAEELAEYRLAASEFDLVGIADALVDLLYVVLGAGCLHGIDLAPIFDEVHRSNLTKSLIRIDVPKTIEGQRCVVKRCVKGEGYEPPRIAELLLIQSTELTDV